MRFPFGKNNNAKKKKIEYEPENLKAVAMVINENKAQQVEEAALRQIYNWLNLCIQNGGNSDYVLLALLKSYFYKQINNQFPKYKILSSKFIKKVENVLNEYFKLKEFPIANPSLIAQVIPQIQQQQKQGEQEPRLEEDSNDAATAAAVKQSKKIINDSMEYWQKETESMVNHIKKVMNTYDCFTDQDMLEYDKYSANLIDSSGRYTSIVSRFADKMLSFESGK